MADQADNGETDPAAPGQRLLPPMLAKTWASQLQQEWKALQSLKAGSHEANEQSEAFLKRLDAQLATLLGKESAAWPEQFRGLAADEQGLTLATLVFAGNAEGQRSGQPDPLRRELDRLNLAIALGTGSEPGAALPAELGPWRAVFTALAADGQGQVLKALSDFAIATTNERWRQPCHLALALPMMERQNTDSAVVGLLRQQPLQDDALSQAADFWLTQLGAGLAHPTQRPRQTGDALCLARHRLALRRPARRAAAAQMSRLAKASPGLDPGPPRLPDRPGRCVCGRHPGSASALASPNPAAPGGQ